MKLLTTLPLVVCLCNGQTLTLEAARVASSPDLRARAASLATPGRGLLTGGDAMRGARVFREHPAAQCVRCHMIDGAGGITGPDLSQVGARDRGYLRQALLEPSAVIAPGYGTTTLRLADGRTLTGTVRIERTDSLTILADDTLRTIATRSVLTRTPSISAMPAMSGLLTPHELRDVIEYLASRRDTLPDAPLDVARWTRVEPARARVTLASGTPEGTLHLGGASFTRGVRVHGPTTLDYAIPDGARVFVARVGVDDGATGTAGFTVRVDGRVVWSAGPMRRGRVAHVWAALPPGARVLELTTDDGGNGPLEDRVDWVEPGFLR